MLLLASGLAACKPGSDPSAPSGYHFERFGTEPHVLWWHAEAGEAEKPIRQRLEQMMVDRAWFMYESVGPAIFTASMLGKFELIILSTYPGSRASTEEIPVQTQKLLDEFEVRGGRVLWISDPGELGKAL